MASKVSTNSTAPITTRSVNTPEEAPQTTAEPTTSNL